MGRSPIIAWALYGYSHAIAGLQSPALSIYDHAMNRSCHQSIQCLLDDVLPQIVEQASPLRVLLFGSAIHNSDGQVNDLDFLVIVPDHDRPSYVTDRLNVGIRNKPIPCDFLVTTPSVLARYGKRRDSVYATALTEGKEVYAR